MKKEIIFHDSTYTFIMTDFAYNTDTITGSYIYKHPNVFIVKDCLTATIIKDTLMIDGDFDDEKRNAIIYVKQKQ